MAPILIFDRVRESVFRPFSDPFGPFDVAQEPRGDGVVERRRLCVGIIKVRVTRAVGLLKREPFKFPIFFVGVLIDRVQQFIDVGVSVGSILLARTPDSRR